MTQENHHPPSDNESIYSAKEAYPSHNLQDFFIFVDCLLPTANGPHPLPTAYWPLPTAFAYWGFNAIPVFLLLSFALPVVLGAVAARRHRVHGADRLLTCHRLPLFLRGTASLLAATMLLSSLPVRVLAQEWELYEQLETSNWGRSGSVTLYEYDDNGSLTRKTVDGGGDSVVETYAYDLGNRLDGHVRTLFDGAETTVTTTVYRHSAGGIRVGRAVQVAVDGEERSDLRETTNFLVDPYNPTGYAQVVEERDGAGAVLRSYTIGDDVLSQSEPSSTAYFLYDGHGSTRQLSDSLGGITAQYAYDAYGVMLGQKAGAQQAQATSLLYSGEQFDPALQQYHLRARDYNQANGQFTSLDPYGGNPHDPQSLHKYAYCHGDPVNGVDPSGEMRLTDLCVAMTISSMVIGGIIGASMRADGLLARVRNALCGVVFGYFLGTIVSMAASSVVVVGYLGWGVFSGATFLEANLILLYGTAFYAGASQNSWILQQLHAGLKMVSRVFQKIRINISVVERNASKVPSPAGDGGAPKKLTLIYRGGSASDANLTPRTQDGEGLSTFETLDAATPPGAKAQIIDTSRLKQLEAFPDAPPPGHVSVRPIDKTLMDEWIQSRDMPGAHPFTQELRDAIIETVKRPKS